jgi:hypothetical protein
MRMSGSSKVEMSAVPAQCRDARTPHVEHEAQLTVNYKRGLYILEDSVENPRLRQKTALASEDADGIVTIHGNGRAPRYRLHPRDQPRPVPGGVEHRHHEGGEVAVGVRVAGFGPLGGRDSRPRLGDDTGARGVHSRQATMLPVAGVATRAARLAGPVGASETK